MERCFEGMLNLRGRETGETMTPFVEGWLFLVLKLVYWRSRESCSPKDDVKMGSLTSSDDGEGEDCQRWGCSSESWDWGPIS